MTTHIDTMQEWWKLAEVGIPQAGDTVIFDERHRGLGFHVTQATKDHPRGYDSARILSRAPKPEPAWVDARAIVAHTDGNPRPSVWTWHKSMDRWDDEGGCHWANTEDLTDVTPLIEAKVTDEMVERARDYMSDQTGQTHTRSAIRGVLTAALGLDPA